MPEIGLQLYTLKEETAKDFFGTLRKVAAMGYPGVEFAGYFGASSEELKQLLDDIGLKTAATHINIKFLESDLESAISYALAIGSPTIICPNFREPYRNDYVKTAELFNYFGKICHEHGLAFVYHIHGHEFASFEGKTGMDLLLEHTDPVLVQFEFDTYWVEAAGIESVGYYEKIGDRCPYIHVKDYNNHADRHDVEVGTGIVNVRDLVRIGLQKKVKWIVIEQEAFSPELPPLESIAVSLKNLQAIFKEVQSQ